MARLSPESDQPELPSKRIERFRQEAQSLINQGGEQPQFEFKRNLSLTRENLEDRLDFIKLVQALANAEIAGERCIVIGGDPRERRFFSVTNSAELDAANISKILASYLAPLPIFNVHHVTTDAGERFVLFVLDADQPRPIFVIKQGHTQGGKLRLEVGDVWIKKNTDTVRALSGDFEMMIKIKIEAEAEDRARKRLKHLLEITPTSNVGQAVGSRLPVRDFLVGPKAEMKRFAEELIANSDVRKYQIQIELARESLVEHWGNLRAHVLISTNLGEFRPSLSDFFRDEFLTSLHSVVTLGLQVIKYQAGISWLDCTTDLLKEGFEASIGVQAPAFAQLFQGESLRSWRPAFEVYAGFRALAIYAIHRSRYQYLRCLLPHFVSRIIGNDVSRIKYPLIFWPFPSGIFLKNEIEGGMSELLWKERIGTTWKEYFGSFENFLDAACELEFLLEFNSYLGTNTPKDDNLKNWLVLNGEGKRFQYYPDLYCHDLGRTEPMAECLFDIVATADTFPAYLSIAPGLQDALFSGKDRDTRLREYGKFLYFLKDWQERTAFEEFHRWPLSHDWEGQLQRAVQAYLKEQPSKL